MFKTRIRLVGAMLVPLMGLAFIVGSVGTSQATATRSPAAATSATSFTNIPITGNTSNGDTFSGVLTVTRFATNSSGALRAVGGLSGTLTDTSGKLLAAVTNRAINMPAAVMDATCPILDLRLGPLHLDLLGLVVTLNRVHLRITAVSGPGNLLGNLLCAIAHLLDQPPSTLSLLLTAVDQASTVANVAG